VRLRIRALPRAARTAVAGPHGDTLKVRVAAPPVDGAANEELVRFISKMLHVPRAAVRVVAGQTGRNKVIEVRGSTASAIRAALSKGTD